MTPVPGRILRFGSAGLMATATHVLVAMLGIQVAALHPAVANAVAFTCATALSYALNTLWTFTRKPSAKNVTRYLLVCLGGLALTVFISGAANFAGLSYQLGIAIVVIVVAPMTYLFHSSWTYRI